MQSRFHVLSLRSAENADTLELALGKYFLQFSTSNSPPQPPERWHIRTTAIEDRIEAVSVAVRYWFFELEYSPKVDLITADDTVLEVLTLLNGVVHDATTYEVQITPPLWYECSWQDLAFDRGRDRWLIHFGFSD